MRFLIADDHGLYRKGLRAILVAAFPEVEIIEAASFDATMSCLKTVDRPDLIVLDLNMPGSISFENFELLRTDFPECRIVVLSASDDRGDILSCLDVGLHGFISKMQSDDAIVAAIRDILDGRIYVTPRLAEQQRVARSNKTSSRADEVAKVEFKKLTRRQQEVLPLMARGMSNKEIARALDLAEATIKIHIAGLLRALNARNRTEAALMAQRVLRQA